MRGARMLVTGVAGFLGRQIAARLLARGHDVWGIDLPGGGSAPEMMVPHQIFRLDVLRVDALQDALVRIAPDVVFHLVGIFGTNDLRALYEANVLATANVLEAIVSRRIPTRVLLASSSAVYGRGRGSALLDEDDPVQPVTQYGASKAAAELVALRYARAEAVPVTLVRAFNLIGPGQPSTLMAGSVARKVVVAEKEGGGRILVGRTSAVRDFIDVRDAADAYVALAENRAPCPIYNVCSGHGTPVAECIETLVGAARAPIDVEFDPSPARADDVDAQVGSHARLNRDLGWTPSIPLERSLRDLLEACRSTAAGGEAHPCAP